MSCVARWYLVLLKGHDGDERAALRSVFEINMSPSYIAEFAFGQLVICLAQLLS